MIIFSQYSDVGSQCYQVLLSCAGAYFLLQHNKVLQCRWLSFHKALWTPTKLNYYTHLQKTYLNLPYPIFLAEAWWNFQFNASKCCSSAEGEDRRSLQSFEDLERKRTAEVRFVSCVAPEKNKKTFVIKFVALIAEK